MGSRRFGRGTGLVGVVSGGGGGPKSGPPRSPQGRFPPATEESDKPASDNAVAAQDKPAPPDKVKPAVEPELFAGCKKRQVALVITGNQHGDLDPSGCAGLPNQKGRLARRHSFIKHLIANGWEVLPPHAGTPVR